VPVHAPAAEVAALLSSVGASAVLCLSGDAPRLRAAGLVCCELTPDARTVGLFALIPAVPASPSSRTCALAAGAAAPRHRPAGRTDRVLILFTSGSTGARKAATYTLRTLLVAAGCVARSWELGPDHTSLTAMPLHHVGGIVRGLVAPLLAGGSALILPGPFSPAAVWDELAAAPHRAWWFYAGPALHAAICAEAVRRSRGHPGRAPADAAAARSVWLVSNASGPLPSEVALQLQVTFPQAAVLPSYGSTECMPIGATAPSHP
jgi:acyl-CoA synthetase (AMP-forming)/AMP-acid ligase II